MVAVLKNRKKVLNQVLRFLVCLLLCFLLLFNYSIREPVEAAPAVAIVGGVVVLATLTLLGIGFSASVSNQTTQSFSQNIWDSIPDNVRETVTASYVIGGSVVYKLSEDFIRNVYNQFHQNVSFAVNIPDRELACGDSATLLSWLGVTGSLTMDNPGMAQVLLQSTKLHMIGQIKYSSDASKQRDWIQFKGSQSGSYYQFQQLGTSYHFGYYSSSLASEMPILNVSDTWSQLRLMDTAFNGATVSLLTAYDSVYSGGQQIFMVLTQSNGSSIVCPRYNNWAYDGYGTAPDVINGNKVLADGFSALNNKLDDVINRLKSIEGAADGSISAHVAGDNTVPQVRAQDQTTTAGKEIATTDDRTKDTDYNKDKDNTKPTQPKPGDLPNLSLPQQIFMKKFPFCIPWDMYTSIKMMAAPAAAPKVDVPVLVIPKLGWNYSVTLDLSKPECSTLGAISRWGFYALFLFALMLLTRKVIWK